MATTLEMLLNELARNGSGLPAPAPSMPLPVRTVPAPNLGMPIAPAQEVPTAPLDTGIINRHMAAAGPAPTAPVQRQPSTLDKIAAVLSGIGGGPQYAMALREEIQRPQREYQAQLRDYNDRQTNLRLRGIDAAERDQERRTAQAQRIEDRRFEMEFARETRRLGLADDEQRMRLAQGYELEREAARQRREVAQELERELRQQERDAVHISDQYFGLTRNKALSDEIGRYRAGLKPSLSPAAAALERRVMQIGEIQMGRAISGGGTGRTRAVNNAAQAALDRFNLARQAVISAVQRGDKTVEKAAREAMNRAFKSLARFPRDVRMSETVPGWPYAEMVNSPAPAAAPQQQQQSDPLGVR